MRYGDETLHLLPRHNTGAMSLYRCTRAPCPYLGLPRRSGGLALCVHTQRLEWACARGLLRGNNEEYRHTAG